MFNKLYKKCLSSKKNQCFFTLFSFLFLFANVNAKEFIDFNQPDIGTTIKLNGKSGAQYKIVDGDNGKALEVSCSVGSNRFPGIQIHPKAKVWNLSGYNKVEVDITNLSKQRVKVFVRVDNPGDWRKNPWNCTGTMIPAAATKTVTVVFGYSWGQPGFKLDPAKVNNILIYCANLKQSAKLKVNSIRATAGKVEMKIQNRIAKTIKPINGILADGKSLAKLQLKNRGTESQVTKQGVTITFPANNKRAITELLIRPANGKSWNLAAGNQVEFIVRNIGKTATTVTCRVDNPNSNRINHCVTGSKTIAPGEKKQLIVSFVTDKIWDANSKDSFKFASDKVSAVAISVSKNSEPVNLRVEKIKLSIATATPPKWLGERPPVPGNWVKTFSDDFTKPIIDEAKWSVPNKKTFSEADGLPTLINYNPSWWDKVSVNTGDNVAIKNDYMVITCTKPKDIKFDEPKFKGRKYLTGLVATYGKFTQKYGYFEAKMKMPKTLGMWPAFWMMPDRGKNYKGRNRRDTANGGMEFDIMEHLVRFGPYRYNIAMHWNGYTRGKHKSKGTEDIYFKPDEGGFVTTGLLWEPGKITFYCNGRVVGTWSNKRVADVPGFIQFTMPVGGWGTNGVVDDNGLPAEFVIEYVRAWQKKEYMSIND
jgi:beta-glucanase (GH16 family)